VLHNPYMMHASAVNQDERNAIRLATDIRFADSSKEWDSVGFFLFFLPTPPIVSPWRLTGSRGG
jgi:hypothetical protein